jgi:hypothetical protein
LRADDPTRGRKSPQKPQDSGKRKATAERPFDSRGWDRLGGARGRLSEKVAYVVSFLRKLAKELEGAAF